MDDPSTFKRLVRTIPATGGKPGVQVSQQGEFRVFVEQDLKLCFVTVEHYSNVVQTSEVNPKKIILKPAA